MTAFSTPEFKQTTLTNVAGDSIICWLRFDSGKFEPDFLRNQSTGFMSGFMTEPKTKPEWLIPGCIMSGDVLGVKATLTLEPSFDSSIVEVDEELGEKIKFSYIVNSEFKDGI
jgi:hypothetical protein